jgi:hypothetical protein
MKEVDFGSMRWELVFGEIFINLKSCDLYYVSLQLLNFFNFFTFKLKYS